MAALRPAPAREIVSMTWRGVVLLAVITLFIGLRVTWTAEVWTHLWAALTISTGYAGLLTCAVVAVTLRGSAAMRRLEYVVLGLATMLSAASLPQLFAAGTTTYANDEGTLADLAGTALRYGSDPYAKSWPDALTEHTGMTATLSGHVVSRFEYPPLAVILNALAKPFTHGLPTAGVVSTTALLITMVLMFFLLPAPWRTAAPMICFGLGYYVAYARLGYPTIVALPLLILAVYRWTSIGAGGRLGRSGAISAACLGLATASEQVAWFLAPFLVVGIFLVRRGEMPVRAAARVVCAYTAVAIAAFAVINIPFAVWNFGDWLSGILSPLTQGAIPHGQGLIGVTYYLIGGSGALGFYAQATLLYAVALVVCFGLNIRLLGPAVAILPWTIFFFSIRSQDGYFILPVVVWVVSLLTADRYVLDRAYQPGERILQRIRPGGRIRAIAAAALFLPAAACLAIAIGTPQPLRLAVAPPTAAGPHHVIASLTVTATNTSGHAITPHFALSTSASASGIWIIKSGPVTLPPHTTAMYAIKAPYASATREITDKRIELRVFSSAPDTLSSTVIRIDASQSRAGTS